MGTEGTSLGGDPARFDDRRLEDDFLDFLWDPDGEVDSGSSTFLKETLETLIWTLSPSSPSPPSTLACLEDLALTRLLFFPLLSL